MLLAWPPRSPDATPCDFFLWGYVKDQVCGMFLLLPHVSRDWRYESEPPLKPSRLTCYKQFGTNFGLLWPCIMNVGWRERNQQGATCLMFIIKLLSQHVSGISRTVTFTVHTACVPAPHNHSHHNECRAPYAALHSLVLLMMGIMMPETCWDKSLIINIRLVASCWFLSLHPSLERTRLSCWCL